MLPFADLEQSLRGTVIHRADRGYDATRRGLLFIGRTPDRRPDVIVRAADAADVQATVRFAAAHG